MGATLAFAPAAPKARSRPSVEKVEEQIPEGIQAESDPLFPVRNRGFRSQSVPDEPFRDVVAAIQLGTHVTPQGMRRRYQDLAPAAEMKPSSCAGLSCRRARLSPLSRPRAASSPPSLSPTPSCVSALAGRPSPPVSGRDLLQQLRCLE
jgi:hypothetical protein